MNDLKLRAFVRQVITEAKAKKEEAKKAEKKDKAPKSSGKLMDLKKELASLKDMRDELQVAKFAEKTAATEVEFADLAKFAKELDALKAKGVALESSIDAKIKDIETRISDEKNKIKEMMGIASEGDKKMMDEKKEDELEEARFKKGEDVGKPGKGFAKVAKAAAKEYGSKKAGQKVAGAILKKVVAKGK